MVEAVANGVEDKLVDGLSFKLSPGASYVTNRRSVTFNPQGSNVYESGSGTRLIKIQLSGDEWLDPSTFRVAFDIVNKEDSATSVKRLRVLGGPHGFFRRARLLAGGQVIEDIDNFNRVSQMLQLLKSKHSRQNEMSEGMGVEWSEHGFNRLSLAPDLIAAGIVPVDITGTRSITIARDVRESTFKGIAPGDSQRVLFKPMMGMFNQNKFLPLRYMSGLTLELELISNPSDAVLFEHLYAATGDDAGNTAKTTFYKSNSTNQWRIQNVEVKCDLITLDNALDNSYAEHLLSGKSLPINYNTFVSQMQTIVGQLKPNVNVTRALTRLKSVFVTLEKDPVVGTGVLTHESYKATYAPGSLAWRRFWSPMSVDNQNYTGAPDGNDYVHNPYGEFSFQIQIGSKLYPEYPIRSHSEAFYQLKKTLGVQTSDVHSFDINPRQYRDGRMILAIDTEKVLDAGWTGLNTRAGDLMSVKFEYNSAREVQATATDVNRLADRMHIILHSDQIVEIRDGSVQVFD